ncbi:MAG: polysaccharide export protein [Sneathiella sp.]|nr:polysaccharide export protein [Sneathiella sp.]
MIKKFLDGLSTVILAIFLFVPPAIAQETTSETTRPVLSDIFDGESSSSTIIQAQPTGGEISIGEPEATPSAVRNDNLAPYTGTGSDDLKPFGSQLFTRSNLLDRNIGVNEDYIISVGDRIAIKIWGARTYEQVQSVDLQGNIFLPEIGPVKVEGVRNSQLNTVVKQNVSKVFTDNVGIYTNLLGTQPIGVYVTGAVQLPGRYPGGKTDSVLYYLARAGAIDPNRGSYRSIRILRDGTEIAKIDLYQFLINGELSKITFHDNDTIIVDPQFTTIAIKGEVKNPYRFEVETNPYPASSLLKMARPNDNASHAFIQGTRDGKAYTSYMPLDQIEKITLSGDDKISVVEDHASNSVIVHIVGNSGGPSSFAVPPGTDLLTIARLIEVDTKVANTKSMYLRRKSVAQRQKEAIQRSLYELQRSVLTGSSSSPTEATIRVQEAKLVDSFVSQVLAVEPEGRVVLAGSNWQQTPLEDGDEIVIPTYTDVVLISGEVKIPQTVLWNESYNLADYINASGGASNRGDLGNVLVIKSNGSIHDGSEKIEKGDHIMVLPKQDGKYFAMVKDMFEVIYRVAVSAAVVINAFK